MIYDPEEYRNLLEDLKKDLKTQSTDISQSSYDFGSDPFQNIFPEEYVPNKLEYHGNWMEIINQKITSLTEEDSTKDNQSSVRSGQVGLTGVLGHSKGDDIPRTSAAAYRQEVDSYASRGKAFNNAQDKLSKEKEKEKGAEMGKEKERMKVDEKSDEAEQTPSQ